MSETFHLFPSLLEVDARLTGNVFNSQPDPFSIFPSAQFQRGRTAGFICFLDGGCHCGRQRGGGALCLGVS